MLQVLEWLLTFEMEVSFIWPAPWTTMKVLYLLGRYMPFIDVTLAVFFMFSDGLSVETCGVLYQCVAWMFFCGVAIASLIFTLRTWAVFGGWPRVGLGLLIFYISTWIVAAVPFGLYLQTVTCGYPKVAYPMFADNLFVVIDVHGIYWSNAALDSYPRSVSLSGTNSNLVRVVYHDGILYYIYMFIISLLNFLVVFKFSNEHVDLLLTMERVLQSVLACRVVLHIRQEAQKTVYVRTLPDT
ncbi:hypothetical protein P691DRAFT_766460 [Macrolepiota fuliginosa MF-IS2]|uniref:DUF6533 domain-containing protein n=1 Tax=Macrolepiota fuliginosa MF-IS2 TaxID=1400762 RepID=A0A9P5WZP3_9AGAR|nr:hypothetical protein P691DRAFT_766460 [Macrolepiota fuliginosa MF-IS2]